MPRSRRSPWYKEIIEDRFEDELSDPIQAVVDRLLNTSQAENILGEIRNLLDRAGNALDPAKIPLPSHPRSHTRPPPRARPRPRPPDPVLMARRVLHFGLKEPLDKTKITKRRKDLAILCHPDRGGNTGAMQRLNLAADCLLASLQ